MRTLALSLILSLLCGLTLTACVVTPGYYRAGPGYAYPAGSAWVPGHYGHHSYWVRGHWR